MNFSYYSNQLGISTETLRKYKMSVEQAAENFGCSRSTMLRMIKSGKVKANKIKSRGKYGFCYVVPVHCLMKIFYK